MRSRARACAHQILCTLHESVPPLFFFFFFFWGWVCCGFAGQGGWRDGINGQCCCLLEAPAARIISVRGPRVETLWEGAGRVNRSTGNRAATRSAVSGSLPPPPLALNYIAVKRYPRLALYYSILACAPSFRVQGYSRPRSWQAFRTVGGKR